MEDVRSMALISLISVFLFVGYEISAESFRLVQIYVQTDDLALQNVTDAVICLLEPSETA
jgi:hypothetical protein